MRRLLWIGDAACDSGFARATHKTVDVLRRTWDVHVIGLNYRGDPHWFREMVRGQLYPAYLAGTDGDGFGLARLPELLPRIGPDVVVVQNDPWNIPAYLRRLADQVPVVASLAVDGKNCRGRGLTGLTLAVFWTAFAEREALEGGYEGLSCVIPLGVDLDTYYPMERAEARTRLTFLPERFKDAFIVGNVNRNQPRKRLDLTIGYFADWVKSRQVNDAALFLHVAPTGDKGYDLRQLAGYYGVKNMLIMSEPKVWQGLPERALCEAYNCFDVAFLTPQGEGMGLTALEAMACRRAVVAPDWAAYGDWARDAAWLVRCGEVAATPNNVNAIGGVMDRADAVAALDALYRDRGLLDQVAGDGYARACEPRFRWENIGQQFADALDQALARSGHLPHVPRSASDTPAAVLGRRLAEEVA